MTHHATRQLAEFVVSTSLSQTPPDFVVKYQAIDIVDVILRLI